ncbi:MAG: ArnT family glycosyltransferase [Acidobacteriota bacterium]
MDKDASERGERASCFGLERLLLLLSAGFYVAGFIHLRADFPNGSPWMDWSKMTDEGWYGGAAIHHFVQGSWYLPDSFNPSVAMPVWPLMLAVWFAAFGVSMIAARILTMLLYGVSLALLYRLVRQARSGPLAAGVVLLTVINPFCYCFDRLAVLEPVTVFWMMMALWLAGETPRESRWRQILLGILIFLLVLTKVTGVVLVPAVLYMMAAGWEWPSLAGNQSLHLLWDRDLWRGAAALAVPVGTAAVLWEGYMRFLVRPRYRDDYRFLFKINAYHAHLSIVPKMAWVALRDGGWMNPVEFFLGVVLGSLALVWLRELWKIPLFGAAFLAMLGNLAYIGYHTNFQPRYYLVIAMPLAILVGLGAAALWDRCRPPVRRWSSLAITGVVAGSLAWAALGMAVQTIGYVLHPEYTFRNAANGIAAVVGTEGGAAKIGARSVLLSDSGDDITLWTGIPAVCASLDPHGLDATLNRYKPRWFAAWPGWESPTIEKLGRRYRMIEVAHYRVFDDPKRQNLVLYQLMPISPRASN